MEATKTAHIEGYIRKDRKNIIYLQNKEDNYIDTVLNRLTNSLGDCHINVTEDEFDSGCHNKYRIPRVGLRLYFSGDEITLEQAKKYTIDEMFGLLTGEERWCGHSQFTIMDIWLETFTVGGHDIMDILTQHIDHYVHIELDVYEES